MRVEQVLARYRAGGYKITPQRLAVMRVLEGDRTHPTAAAVVERVRRDFPFISAATVYRVLEELVEMGEILALDLGNGGMRFDPRTAPHAHLVCTACGRVSDVDWRLGEDVLPAHLRQGYEVSGVQVVFNGRCPACREAAQAGPAAAGGGEVAGPAGEGGDGGEGASPAVRG